MSGRGLTPFDPDDVAVSLTLIPTGLGDGRHDQMAW